MDEPFSGLDPRLTEKMREETLAILHETRATSIVVIHDAEEAMRMRDRAVRLRRGSVVYRRQGARSRRPHLLGPERTQSPHRGRSCLPAWALRGERPCRRVSGDGCVRQRGVRGVPARVLDARASSATWRSSEIAVLGLGAPILARMEESDVPPQGAEIGVGIDAGAVLVFEADNGDPPAARA